MMGGNGDNKPPRPPTTLELAKRLQETNERIDRLVTSIETLSSRESSPVDEASIVEKIQAQIARAFLPAIEQLQNSMKQVGAAVGTIQTGLDAKIQAQVETIFMQNQDSIKQAIADRVAAAQPQGAISEGGGEAAPAATPRQFSLIPSGVVTELVTAIAANADGILKVASIFKPSPPPGQQIADVVNFVMKGVSIGERIGRGENVPAQEITNAFINKPT